MIPHGCCLACSITGLAMDKWDFLAQNGAWRNSPRFDSIVRTQTYSFCPKTLLGFPPGMIMVILLAGFALWNLLTSIQRWQTMDIGMDLALSITPKSLSVTTDQALALISAKWMLFELTSSGCQYGVSSGLKTGLVEPWALADRLSVRLRWTTTCAFGVTSKWASWWTSSFSTPETMIEA